MKPAHPIPSNELERIDRLSDLDIDYTDLQDALKDLSKLAAKVAGTSISLINIIDTLTQWTVSNYGLDIDQMAREDSVCQYTIMGREGFEVKDLTKDERFRDKFYVTGQPNLTYYFGVPLSTSDGYNLGALCVMDKVGKEISPEKIEMLTLIANEVVSRISVYRVMQQMRDRIKEAKDSQRKVAHDIRGPLGGIIGLAEIISSQGDQNKMDQVLEFISLIRKSGSSLLDLANEILSSDKTVIDANAAQVQQYQFNLQELKQKLEKLYLPQALAKQIQFRVEVMGNNGLAPLSKNKLLQITGNLISNAIKFTPPMGKVEVELDLMIGKGTRMLKIAVRDTGMGIEPDAVNQILSGNVSSSEGTMGEQGYGFGLSLVKKLVSSMNGALEISSEPGKGSVFYVQIHQ
jgi:signal transduction histidine kinase